MRPHLEVDRILKRITSRHTTCHLPKDYRAFSWGKGCLADMNLLSHDKFIFGLMRSDS